VFSVSVFNVQDGFFSESPGEMAR